MNQKQKDNEEEKESVDSKINFDHLLKIFCQFIPFFESLQHPDEFEHFNHLVEFGNFNASEHPITAIGR